MFVRNSWTVAALSEEVTRIRPLARTIMNEGIVIYRTREGEPVALRDRCPHRFAPLSVGQVIGDGMRCGYHGMTFDRFGHCVDNPTQPGDRIPAQAQVKTYPLVERHKLIWIWMGDSERADPATIPDYSSYDSADYAAGTGYMLVKANYLLLVDNLLDLTHIAFVHADILGNPEVMVQPSAATEIGERSVVEKRLTANVPAVPAWKIAFNDYDKPVDMWMDMYWEAGSNMILDVGVTAAGRPRDEGVGIMGLDCLTPETETTTHYFYGAAHKYRRDEPAITSFWMQAIDYAFGQDKRMVEAVQANMGSDWDILRMHPIANKADRAALQARRIVERLVALETTKES